MDGACFGVGSGVHPMSVARLESVDVHGDATGGAGSVGVHGTDDESVPEVGCPIGAIAEGPTGWYRTDRARPLLNGAQRKIRQQQERLPERAGSISHRPA